MDIQFYYNLSDAINRASVAATNAATDNDGGSCNFDQPVIALPDDVDDELMHDLDIPVRKINEGFFEGLYVVRVPLLGQGFCRTRMAEAAAKSLIDDGYDALVWYQMD